ncbi:MAG: putative ArsR family transcriptional regulator [Maricaulis sp.]|jgi:predicted ArsR family transcriptional regulator
MDDLNDRFKSLPISRDRDQFLRELIRELAATLEEVVGLDEAEVFISVVGNRIGDMMNAEYRELTQTERLDIEQTSAALVDLKRRIDGGFSVESVDEEELVLVNTRCPFGQDVIGHRSLCMMTSNVFGRIAADNNGYARVEIEQSIAAGDKGCRVVVSLRPVEQASSHRAREYFGRD